ncbi:hypothetical protein [Microbulbifer discodermiae]|uniref:hypothetical protein n=1 Tax=Microbulbifer sp. 2201CG32-9 TaxID=3232309 RepID=UPI00345BDD81
MKKTTIALLLLSLTFLNQSALAAMSLDKIILYLDDTPDARQDIVVTNPDPETLYLRTEIFRVDNPGQPDERRVRVVDPKEFKLLVSPSKAVLASGERKRFRLMSLERGLEQEKVYRVTFRPVVGDIKTERTALKILVAYQALVFVQPKDGQYQLELEDSDGGWVIKNTGNINVEITDLKHCTDTGECHSIEGGGRLYAGAGKVLDSNISGGFLELLARGRETRKLQLPLK